MSGSGRDREPGLGETAPGEERASFEVPAALDGERIDKAIAACVEALSRGRARKLLSQGAVLHGRKRCRVASRLVRTGDRVTVTWRDGGDLATGPPLEVVHEDAYLAVIAKPPGQHTQGTALGDEGTVARLALKRFGPQARVAHRLDAPTSGLLLIGKTEEAVARLRPLVEGHEIDRRYLALCEGSPPDGRCDRRLMREGRRTVLAPDDTGRSAVTWFESLASRESVTLVRARLETGRTHQVRVHLQSLGSPIVGDRLYGGTRAERLALHAWRLTWVHPFTGESVDLRLDPDEGFWASAGWTPHGLAG